MLDRKRILIVICFIIFISIFIGGVYFFINNKNKSEKNDEYIPEEEISDSQIRQTIISLYFKKDGNLIPEERIIDVKELINNPYEIILNMLIEGSKNNNLQNTIPEGTKINKIEKIGETLIIDFSEEFVINHTGGEKEEKLTIDAIVKTLTELTEINEIKIKINGEENKEFKDGIINFKSSFNRKY